MLHNIMQFWRNPMVLPSYNYPNLPECFLWNCNDNKKKNRGVIKPNQLNYWKGWSSLAELIEESCNFEWMWWWSRLFILDSHESIRYLFWNRKWSGYMQWSVRVSCSKFKIHVTKVSKVFHFRISAISREIIVWPDWALVKRSFAPLVGVGAGLCTKVITIIWLQL